MLSIETFSKRVVLPATFLRTTDTVFLSTVTVIPEKMPETVSSDTRQPSELARAASGIEIELCEVVPETVIFAVRDPFSNEMESPPRQVYLGLAALPALEAPVTTAEESTTE